MAKYTRTFLWLAMLLMFLLVPLIQGCSLIKTLTGPQYQVFELPCPEGTYALKLPMQVNKNFLMCDGVVHQFWDSVVIVCTGCETDSGEYSFYNLLVDRNAKCPGVIALYVSTGDKNHFWIYKDGMPIEVDAKQWQEYVYGYVGRELGEPGKGSKPKGTI